MTSMLLWSTGSYETTLTFAASDDRNITRARTTVENNWFLYPGNEKVCAFPYYHILNALESVKNNSSVARIN